MPGDSLGQGTDTPIQHHSPGEQTEFRRQSMSGDSPGSHPSPIPHYRGTEKYQEIEQLRRESRPGDRHPHPTPQSGTDRL